MPLKAPILRTVIMLLLIAVTFSDGTTTGAAAKTKVASIELYQQVAKAQAASEKDQAELLEKMQTIASEFKKYRAANGQFPEQGSMTDALEQKLRVIAGVNPYADFPFSTAADDPQFAAVHGEPNVDPQDIDVKINVDLGLSNMGIEQFRTSVPDNWLAMPGTITIIHNTENLFIVWGAGVDGRPIHDGASGNYAVISSDF